MPKSGLSPVAKRVSRVGRVNATPYHMMSVSEEDDPQLMLESYNDNL